MTSFKALGEISPSLILSTGYTILSDQAGEVLWLTTARADIILMGSTAEDNEQSPLSQLPEEATMGMKCNGLHFLNLGI